MISIFRPKGHPPLSPHRDTLAGVTAALCVAFSALLCLAGTLRAQMAGDLDTTFGNGGKAAFTPHLGGINALALQGDGKIVAGGLIAHGAQGSDDFGVSRYNADGSVDTTFGDAGTGALNFDFYGQNLASDSADRVTDVIVQSDGKILAAGYTYEYDSSRYDDSSFAVARFKADGSLDTGFGTGGKTELHANRSLEIEYGTVRAVLQADGKIVLAAASFTQPNIGGDFVLARLLADGSVDGSFGSGGLVVTHLLSQSDSRPVMSRLVAQPDGKLLVVGRVAQNTVEGVTQGGALIIRYNADGTLDAGFANGGTLIFDYSATGGSNNYDTVTDILLEPDGRLTAVGTVYVDGSRQGQSFLVRLKADGSVDPGFGTSGFAVNNLYHDTGTSFREQSDGKYLLAYSDDGSNLDFALARLNHDGTVDTGFGTVHGGYVLTDFEGGDDVATSLILQPDGKVLVGGGASISSSQPAGERFALARYETATSASAHPAFFDGETTLSDGVYYLHFPGSGNPFGFYAYLSDPHYIYHFDLGYEYVFDANDSGYGVYLYDFKSGTFFYTSPVFPFPYLYDFSLNSTVYYYPDPNNPGRYNTNGIRYFYDFANGQIISK